MRTVLFLGAGFSAAFGQPTMNQFVSYVLRNLPEKDQEFVMRLVAEARSANAFLESSPTNLEDILSFAIMGDRLRFYGSEKKRRGPRLKNILRVVYSSEEGDLSAFWDRRQLLKSYLGFEEDDARDLAIITTNYDLNAEVSIWHLNRMPVLPFKYDSYDGGLDLVVKVSLYQRQDEPQSANKQNAVPLLKLHGSANWHKGPKRTTLVADIMTSGDARVRGRSFSAPLIYFSDYIPPEGEPIIVPPSFLKPDTGRVLERVWQRAAEELRSADELTFIGYSFPETDVEMKYFLAASLNDNRRLQRITIADVNATQIVARLCEPDSGYGSHFKGMIEPLDGKWEDQEGSEQL